ncbi:MAG: EpsG family protein [Clostridia bacterium]|nr:EpsG family protein [Clostridia bacterium]
MMVYWSMFIYTIVVSMVVDNMSKRTVLFKEAVSGKKMMFKRVGLFGGLLTFFLVVFFAGHRCDVADSFMYISYYGTTTGTVSDIPAIMQSDAKSPLFDAIIIFCKQELHYTYHEWFMLLAFFQGFTIARFISRFSENFSFSSYMFVAEVTFYWMMNGIRQFTAVCIVLLVMEQFFNKKWIPFLIAVYLAYKVHSSAAIWIGFFIQAHWKPFATKTLIAILVVVILFSLYISGDMEGTDYEGYNEQSEYEDDGVNIFQVLIYAVPGVIAFSKRKIILSKKRPYYIDVMINLSIIVFGIDFIGMMSSQGVTIGRLPIYFSLCNNILIPWLIDNAFDNKTKPVIQKLAIGAYLFYYVYYAYIVNNGLSYHSRSLGISLYSY